MSRRQRRIGLAVLVSAAVLVAAGCGSSGSSSSSSTTSSSSNGSVPNGDVAVVAGTAIPRKDLDDLLAVVKVSYKSKGQSLPQAGSAEYQALEQQAVASLVRGVEFRQQATKLGVTVTEAQIDAEFARITKQYEGGSATKLDAALKSAGYTRDTYRPVVRDQLLRDGIYKAITKDVTVTAAEVRKYYDSNKSTYTTPEKRRVRHILVALNSKGVGVQDPKAGSDTKVDYAKSKVLADKLYAQLRSGGDFVKLVKTYSQDGGSKSTGGVYTETKGLFAPEFEKAAFALKTNEISKPVKTQFGYHIIQALGPLVPAKTKSFASVEASIRALVLKQKQQTAAQAWATKIEKEYAKKISYAAGVAPPATAPTTTATTP